MTRRVKTAPQSLAGTDAIEKVAANILSFLKSWTDQKLSRKVSKEIDLLESTIDRFASSTTSERYKYRWTAAVYVCLKVLAKDPSKAGLASERKWTLYPTERPYAGEFITDFAIYEEKYGFRVACESQWHEGGNNVKRVSDAFAKLLHVKSDLKVLIFESDHGETNARTRALFEALRNNYLTDYMHFSGHEDYLLMQWSGAKVKCYLWRPFVTSELVPL
jgi:hypothetical protein